MRKYFIVLMCALVSVVCSCSSQKKIADTSGKTPQTVVNKESEDLAAKIERKKQEAELRELERQEELKQLEFEKKKAALENTITEIPIPCIESSFDDDDYFRDYGIGNVEGNNQQAARARAVQAAKEMIKNRLGEYVEGVTDYFFASYAGSKEKDAAESRSRVKINGLVEGMLRNADKVCEKSGRDAKGNLLWYYTIQIPKKELNKKIMDVLSEEQKLKIDFDAEQMQKFMDERMEQMKEAKKKAGY